MKRPSDPTAPAGNSPGKVPSTTSGEAAFSAFVDAYRAADRSIPPAVQARLDGVERSIARGARPALTGALRPWHWGVGALVLGAGALLLVDRGGPARHHPVASMGAPPAVPRAQPLETPPAEPAASAPFVAPSGGVTTFPLGAGAPGLAGRSTTHRVTALHAAPDGRVYLLGGSTELGSPMDGTMILRGGAPIGRLGDLDGGGSPRPGLAITADAHHLFVAVTVAGPSGAPAFALRRYLPAGAPAPFPGGEGRDGSLRLLASGGAVRALAHSEGELFVAQEGGGISVLDAASLTLRRAFAVDGARALAADPAGRLWIATATTVRPHDRQGRPTGAPLPVDSPVALAVDGGGRLLVADGGARQQVLVFADLAGDPRLVATHGSPGGLQAAGGDASDPRRFAGIAAIGAASDGTLLVGMNLAGTWGARLVALLPDGALAWQAEALASGESAAVDPGAGGDAALDVYTKGGRFRIEGAAGPARLVGWTIDGGRHPEDPRLDDLPEDPGSASVVRVGGRRLLGYLREHRGVTVYRFAEGETAIPAFAVGAGAAPGQTFGAEAVWAWRDRDGDGRPRAEEYERLPLPRATGTALDEAGRLWWATSQAGLFVFSPEGFDGRGVPLYGAPPVRHPMPAPFRRIQRVAVTGEDLLVAGYTDAQPSGFGRADRVALGTELVRIDDFATAPTVRWRMPLDTRGGGRRRPHGFAVAGQRLFLTYTGDPAIRVLDAATAEPLGILLPDGGVGGRLDTGRAWLPLEAHERPSGETLLFAAHPALSRVVVFRIGPSWPHEVPDR